MRKPKKQKTKKKQNERNKNKHNKFKSQAKGLFISGGNGGGMTINAGPVRSK